MKALIVTFVIVGAIVAGLIYFGGFVGMDPAADAQNFTKSVAPGMTWQEVVAVKKPRKVIPLNPTNMTGQSNPLKWDQAEGALNNNSYTDGFIFPYVFSADHQYEVWFDGDGKVTDIQKQKTFNDLASGNI